MAQPMGPRGQAHRSHPLEITRIFDHDDQGRPIRAVARCSRRCAMLVVVIMMRFINRMVAAKAH